jgi:hypothetical protein
LQRLLDFCPRFRRQIFHRVFQFSARDPRHLAMVKLFLNSVARFVGEVRIV